MSLDNYIGTLPLLPFVLLSSVISLNCCPLPLIIGRAVFASKKGKKNVLHRNNIKLLQK